MIMMLCWSGAWLEKHPKLPRLGHDHFTLFQAWRQLFQIGTYQWWQKIVEFRGAGAQSGYQIGEEGMISYTPRT